MPVRSDKLAFVKQYARYRHLDSNLTDDLLRFFRYMTARVHMVV